MGKKKYIYVAVLAAAILITLFTPMSVLNKFFACAACGGAIYVLMTDNKPESEEKK
jgi:hypothetical protein